MATKAVSQSVADHEIEIIVQGNEILPIAIPEMQVGETVRYTSRSGNVRIVFPDRSPFRTDTALQTEVPGSVLLTLLSDSGEDALPCQCFVTLSDGTTVGWDPSHPNAGGVVKVTKPGPRH
jgi:hypothetical protein